MPPLPRLWRISYRSLMTVPLPMGGGWLREVSLIGSSVFEAILDGALARQFAYPTKVYQGLYPGLATQYGHTIAKLRMVGGFGGMMSFLLKADFAGSQKFCTKLKLFAHATSLGGVECLAEHRKTVEGPTSNLPDNLVRFSVGIENVNYLIADL